MAPIVMVQRRRVPLWRRLVSLADSAVPGLLRLWRGLLLNLRRRLTQREVIQALQTHRLEARSHIAQILQTTLEAPARRQLAGLAEDLVGAAAAIMVPAIERQVGGTVPLTLHLPEARFALDAYVGEQVRDISQTTMTTVQGVLRESTQVSRSLQETARALQRTLGLTPRQQQARTALQTRLEAQGLAPAEVQRQLEQATAQGIQRRALMIAKTQAVTLVNMGVQHAWQDAAQAGRVEATHVRRYWNTQAGCCALCSSVASTYAHGVGLHEAFETPWGALLTPPGHPNCRCGIEYHVG